jgi:outer membrane protein assembly factor BamB
MALIRKLLKGTMIVAAVAVLAGVVLYLVGLRVVLYGGVRPRLEFVASADARRDEIERHRAGQREAEPAATPAAAPVPSGWPDFRGPRRDGTYHDPIRTDWPDGGLEPLWKQPAGGGYASFSIAGGRAFTIEQRGPEEVVAAYDVLTGRELWTNRWPAEFKEFMGGDGPRATPVWHDDRVYALGALGELRCLDAATGRLIWRTNILDDSGATNLEWGMAASPLVVDDMVVVLPGGRSGQSVMAYHRDAGEPLWAALDDMAAYSSAMVATLAGRRQLLIVTASRLLGLTLDGRDVLWSYPWTTAFDMTAAQPVVVSDNRVFVSSATGGAVVEVTASNGRLDAREVWRNIRMKNQFTTSLLHDGHLYGLDNAILACVDVETGEVRWKGGRYGFGQVLLAGDHLIVLTVDGDLALVRATPARHEELARFPVLEGKSWNHPAMAGGILLVRNLREMAAFDLRAGTVAPPGP